MRLAGVEHALQFTAAEENGGDVVHMRSYRIRMKRSRVPARPRVELEEIGPAVDFRLRRTHLVSY